MRAIHVEQPGGPEVMRLVARDDPSPGQGEALVRVEAAGVNFIDIYVRTGLYKSDGPIRLGREGAGVVERVGDGVTTVREGDRVAWADVPGSYATHVVAPAARLVPVPDGVETRVAAAVMLQGMTAHYLARATYPLKTGDTCLVHAAAGGVGLLLCQMAKAAGARVLGTTSNEDKAARAKAAGADDVILYTREDFAREARRLTDGAGVGVVYDSVGKDTWAQSLDALRPRGMLVLFGQSSGVVPPIDPFLLMNHGSVFLTRANLAHYVATRDELLARAEDVLEAVRAGALAVAVDAYVPLADAAAAHAKLASRATSGKLVLVP